MEDNDVLMALETGINSDCRPKNINDKHQVVRINYQEKKGKD